MHFKLVSNVIIMVFHNICYSLTYHSTHCSKVQNVQSNWKTILLSLVVLCCIWLLVTQWAFQDDLRLSGFPDYLTITLKNRISIDRRHFHGGYMKFCTFHLSISCTLLVIFVSGTCQFSWNFSHGVTKETSGSKVKSLHMNDKVKIADALDISVREVPTVGFVSSKAFLRDVGYQGSVVFKGENVIADINGHETALLINNFCL